MTWPAARPGPRRSLLVVVALAGGAATTLAFAPTSLLVFAIIGPAAGLWAAARSGSARRGATCGLTYGLAFCFVLLRWMLEVDLIAYLVLPLIQAAFWVATGVVAQRLARLHPALWVGGVTAAWIAVEAVRARFPVTGFEWGQLSMATADLPLRHGAAVAGSLGLTAVLVAIAASCAALLLTDGPRRWLPLAVAAGVLAVVIGLGLVRWTVPGATLDVTVVQVDDPCPGAFAEDCPGYSEALLDGYVEGTTAVGSVDLVVWGEDALRGGDTLEAVGQALVDRVGALPAPLLAGTGTPASPGQFLRWAALLGEDGAPLDAYAKRVPVPFGEYVPFRDVLGGISDVDRLVPSDLQPGTDASPVGVPVDDGVAMLGTVVSWEVTFSRLVRDVAMQADGLATLTTVSSYGTSAASDQLLDAAQLRAAEHQKPMVVAATTGRSAFIAPDGALQSESALLRADRLAGQMQLRSGLTPFARTGDLPAVLLAVLCLAAAWVAGRRSMTAEPQMVNDEDDAQTDARHSENIVAR